MEKLVLRDAVRVAKTDDRITKLIWPQGDQDEEDEEDAGGLAGEPRLMARIQMAE